MVNRSSMDDYRYTYAVARINVLSMKLIDRSFAARMLAVEAEEAFRMLNETVYAESIAAVQGPAELDRALLTELERTYDLLLHISPEKELIDIFRRRYDFHNLKVLLKANVCGVAPEGALIALGTYPLDKLSAAVTEKTYRFVPDYIRETATEALSEYDKTLRLSAISYTCDRRMWSYLLEQALNSGNETVIRLIREYVDLANIKAFIRIKEFAENRQMLEKHFIPGGTYPLALFLRYMDEQLSLFLTHLETAKNKHQFLSEAFQMWPEDKSFWRLEVAGDNHILRWLHGMRMALFSIAPLLYYLLRKEAEAKLIRTLIKGKQIGLQRKEIEERMRFLYV